MNTHTYTVHYWTGIIHVIESTSAYDLAVLIYTEEYLERYSVCPTLLEEDMMVVLSEDYDEVCTIKRAV